MIPDYVTVSSSLCPRVGSPLFLTFNLGNTSSQYDIDKEGKLIDCVGQRWFAHGEVFLHHLGSDQFFCAMFDSGVCQSIEACAEEPPRSEQTADVTRIPYDWDPRRS